MKKIKYVLWALLTCVIILFFASARLFQNYLSEQAQLDRFRQSLYELPEVESVLELHWFHGLVSTLVAEVEHINGEIIYYFIQDGLVEYYFFQNDLISESNAGSLAQDFLPEAQIHQITLGILHDIPIYEIMVRLDNTLHYVIITALDSQIKMHFIR